MTASVRPERPPYGVATIVFGAVLGLYVLTIAPTTQFWDTSEYIAAAKVLGIPHPPGNPLFVLLANVWGMLPIVAHYALRINLFAAVTSALASGFLFLCAERFLHPLIDERWPRYAAAIAGVLVGATAFTVWNQSVVNEKVYTLSLLSIALVLWLGLRWVDKPDPSSRDKLLLTILYLLALTSTNHTLGLLVAPAIIALVFSALREENAGAAEWFKWAAFATLATMLVFVPTILEKGAESGLVYLMAAAVALAPVVLVVRTGNWAFAILALLVVCAGFSLNVFFLDIRAGLYPPINEGEPTTGEALRQVLTRYQYQKGPLVPRQSDIVWQYVNFLQYFSWQYGRDWEPAVRRGLAVLFGGLGIGGAVWHWLKDRGRALGLTALILTVTVLLVFYLDFKFGYSIRPGENLVREVRERDYFFIASFQLWGLWAALGFGALLAWGKDFFRERLTNGSAWLAASPILLLSLIPLLGNWLSASRADETLARDTAWDMLQSVEPYGILVTAGDNDTFPLWYMQEVEGVRQDVIVANLSLMNTEWHPRQLKRRPQAPFDSDQALPLYAGLDRPAPTTPVLSLSYDELDNLPQLLPINERRVFQYQGIEAVIEPQVLERADILTLQLIQDNFGKRPIYLSRTTGNFGERMGLSPYLLGHGMVRLLVAQRLQESDSTKQVPGLGWIDIPRSRALLFDAYHVESAARKRPLGWIDEPSESILTLYGILYAAYAELAARSVDTTAEPDSGLADDVARATDWAQRIFNNTSLAP